MKKVNMVKRRLAGEVLIHVYRLMHDVVLFSMGDRVLRWYGVGLTEKERLHVQKTRMQMEEATERVRTMYMRCVD